MVVTNTSKEYSTTTTAAKKEAVGSSEISLPTNHNNSFLRRIQH
jgi:hypothetical protein